MDIVKEIPSKRKAELNHKEVLSSKKMYETGRRIQDILLFFVRNMREIIQICHALGM